MGSNHSFGFRGFGVREQALLLRFRVGGGQKLQWGLGDLGRGGGGVYEYWLEVYVR